MTTRRKLYWWLRVVLSGRFLDRFLALDDAAAPADGGAEPDHEHRS